MEKKKKLWQVLIPVLVALAVIVAFAISGTITRRADEKNKDNALFPDSEIL